MRIRVYNYVIYLNYNPVWPFGIEYHLIKPVKATEKLK